MNERIQELAEQARNYALDEKRIYERVHNTEQCMEEYREVYNKKFAELIVKEFETVAKQQPWYYDAPSCGWRAPINHVCDVVKEHFGVEE